MSKCTITVALDFEHFVDSTQDKVFGVDAPNTFEKAQAIIFDYLSAHMGIDRPTGATADPHVDDKIDIHFANERDAILFKLAHGGS